MWLAYGRRTAVTLVTGSVMFTAVSWGIVAATAGTAAASAAATAGGSESCEPLQATVVSPSPSATKTPAKPTASPTTTKATPTATTATPTATASTTTVTHTDADDVNSDGDAHVNIHADTDPGADPVSRRHGG